MLTVSKLIEELQTYPGDTQVRIYADCSQSSQIADYVTSFWLTKEDYANCSTEYTFGDEERLENPKHYCCQIVEIS